jgi:CheY-like chemotaxis protein
MSLVGNLEDLSLPDILQIVSLSKKSGILTIEREELKGKIFIREGRVTQTVSPRSGKTLGEILTAQGLISPEDLKKCLEIQAAAEEKELLGAIMIRTGAIEQEVLEKVVREQIEEAIVYFLSWKEGSFNFELSEIRERGEISVDAHAFILETGIDTQWLVLEGTRMMDERQRGGGPAVEDTVADAFAEEEAASEEVAEHRGGIVLVDDDPVFRDLAKEKLSRLDYRVVACEGTEEGLKGVKEFPPASPPVVVTDIVFPTSDGRGFLGGLELVEKLRRSQPEVPVIAITAYPDENVKSKVAGFGVSHFLIKPSGAEAEGKEAQNSFFAQLLEMLAAARSEGAGAAKVEEAPAPQERAQLIETIEEAAPPTVEPEGPPAAVVEEEVPVDLEEVVSPREGALPTSGLAGSELALLQEMMNELQNPRATSEIGLLILRFASEVLNRAVLFVVKGGKAVGLGGFGVEVSSAGRGGIRGIAIPLDEPSLLEEVVKRRAAYRGPVVHTPANVRLMEELGGKTPAEAVAIPLVAGGKVRVLLYGDNLPEDRSLPSTQTLEIFLTQAGLTLERVLLEKKLQEKGGKKGGGAS